MENQTVFTSPIHSCWELLSSHVKATSFSKLLLPQPPEGSHKGNSIWSGWAFQTLKRSSRHQGNHTHTTPVLCISSLPTHQSLPLIYRRPIVPPLLTPQGPKEGLLDSPQRSLTLQNTIIIIPSNSYGTLGSSFAPEKRTLPQGLAL